MLQDIARDVRETKVHYSPSEKDGVFVVEVARGADSNSTPIMANMGGGAAMAMEQPMTTISPRQTHATIVEVAEDQPKSVDYASSNDGNVPTSCTRSNEKVLVHPPPNGMEEDVLMIDEDGAVSMTSPKHNGNGTLDGACGGIAITDSGNNVNTGLSQSDLSVSSSGGSNRYCYGQQESYMATVKAQPAAAVTPLNNGIAPIALLEQMELMDQIDSIEAEPNDTNLGIPTPEPITVISDTEYESQINENESPEHALDNNSTFKPEQIQTNIEIINENQISTTPNNGCILATKALPKMNAENGNGNLDTNSNGNDPQLYEHHHQQNGFKSQSINNANISNGKSLNGDLKNGFNGNEHLMDESSDFDSLMNLPAPPTCDEIKQFNDITTLDNGNMDSLPPPPPEILPTATAGPINVGS